MSDQFVVSSDPLDTGLVRRVVFLIGFLLPYVMIEPAPVDLLLAVLPLLILMRTWVVSRTPLVIAAVYYLFSGIGIALSVAFGDIRPNVLISYIVVQSFLLVGVLSLYEIFRRSEAAVLLFFKAFVIGAVISTLIVLALHFSGTGGLSIYRDEFRVRLSGFYKDPNVLGPYLIFPFSALLFSVRELGINRFWKVLSLPVFVLIVLTLSRAAMGGALLAVIATFVLTLRTGITRNALFLGTVMFLLAVSLLALLFDEMVRMLQKVDSLVSRISFQNYDSHRLEDIKSGLVIGFENPFGIGPGVFGKILNTSNPHNLFVGKLVDAGFVPALILCGILFYSTVLAVKVSLVSRNRILICLAGTLLAHIIISMVIYSHHWRHMLFLCVATIAYARHIQLRRRRKTLPCTYGPGLITR